jgi:hypothetical protein
MLFPGREIGSPASEGEARKSRNQAVFRVTSSKLGEPNLTTTFDN